MGNTVYAEELVGLSLAEANIVVEHYRVYRNCDCKYRIRELRSVVPNDIVCKVNCPNILNIYVVDDQIIKID
jgi:hypothetical protein